MSQGILAQRGERTAAIVPTQQTVLEPNEVIKARILLEDIRIDVERAKIRMEVTGGFLIDLFLRWRKKPGIFGYPNSSLVIK